MKKAPGHQIRCVQSHFGFNPLPPSSDAQSGANPDRSPKVSLRWKPDGHKTFRSWDPWLLEEALEGGWPEAVLALWGVPSLTQVGGCYAAMRTHGQGEAPTLHRE